MDGVVAMKLTEVPTFKNDIYVRETSETPPLAYIHVVAPFKELECMQRLYGR